MVIKKVVQLGNPTLRKKTKKVSDFNGKEVKKVVRDLTDSLKAFDLVGMAAPQIGSSLSIFVVWIRKTQYRPNLEEKYFVFINPKIKSVSKEEIVIYEGCGSVGNAQIMGPVKRPKKVVVEALNQKGQKFKLEAEGIIARIIQHEYDHLNGIVFTDKLTDPKKLLSVDEYLRLLKEKKINQNIK